MSFSAIVSDLQAALRSDMAQVRLLVRRNPGAAYQRITEIGRKVGERHGVRLIVNFPKEGRILEFDMYGRRDLSVVIDMQRSRFPVGRDSVKAKAAEAIAGCRTEDAYMYEGKEGVKVFLDGSRGGGGIEGGRIDILPHSLHVWCEFTEPVARLCDWLFANVYERGGEAAAPNREELGRASPAGAEGRAGGGEEGRQVRRAAARDRSPAA